VLLSLHSLTIRTVASQLTHRETKGELAIIEDEDGVIGPILGVTWPRTRSSAQQEGVRPCAAGYSDGERRAIMQR
jgi:hypothetical protein